jgi:ubiquinone biosynthesis accessory factor UbiJ
MFHSMRSALAVQVLERATLLANHVLASEPAAAQRLRPHVGRSLRLQFANWPNWLPPLPPLAFRVTPAALLEWCGEDAPAQVDLQIGLVADNPVRAALQALAGERPRVDVSGDAAFAADVNWLFDNLRWDVEDDLAKLVGPAPAHEMARLARAMASGLRDAVGAVGTMAARARGGNAAGPGAG